MSINQFSPRNRIRSVKYYCKSGKIHISYFSPVKIYFRSFIPVTAVQIEVHVITRISRKSKFFQKSYSLLLLILTNLC